MNKLKTKTGKVIKFRFSLNCVSIFYIVLLKLFNYLNTVLSPEMFFSY